MSFLIAGLLNKVAATGAGPWVDAGNVDKATVQLTGTFVGTVKFEASNDDGTTKADIGGTLTTAGPFELFAADLPVRLIRANVTAYTSGAISAELIGSLKN